VRSPKSVREYAVAGGLQAAKLNTHVLHLLGQCVDVTG